MLVVALLVAGGGLVEFLPSTALAAIVIAAAMKLFDAHQVSWLYSVRRSEFALCIAATVGVVLLGVLNGLAIAIGLSLANSIRRVWRPYDAVLGRVRCPGSCSFVSMHRCSSRTRTTSNVGWPLRPDRFVALSFDHWCGREVINPIAPIASGRVGQLGRLTVLKPVSQHRRRTWRFARRSGQARIGT